MLQGPGRVLRAEPFHRLGYVLETVCEMTFAVVIVKYSISSRFSLHRGSATAHLQLLHPVDQLHQL